MREGKRDAANPEVSETVGQVENLGQSLISCVQRSTVWKKVTPVRHPIFPA